MADFDEKSGIVACHTDWGLWYQTLDEVSIEINLKPGIKSRDIHVKSTCREITVIMQGEKIIEGQLFNSIQSNDLIWTIEEHREEGKQLRIVMPKVDKTAVNTWHSLLTDKYHADEWLLDNMRKKAFLEKMQIENQGFDLSTSEVTGHYATGGPDIPS